MSITISSPAATGAGDRGPGRRRLVEVLLDPGDDVQVTAALLDWHQPDAGRVCVHPTPGATAIAALAHDVLGAIGRPVHRISAEKLAGVAPAWRAVAGWLVADRIEHLVVLRADRLAAAGWSRLLDLAGRTGVQLTLICHRQQIPRALALVLATVEHRIVRACPQGLPAPARQPAPQRTASPFPDREPLPRVGYPVMSWRRRAAGLLGPRRFARADAIYRTATELTDAWLSDWRPARWPRYDDEHLFLFWLVADSPSRTHTLIRIRGYEAAFRRHQRIVSAPAAGDLLNPDRLGGPGLSGRHVTDEIAEQIRAGVAHPVVAAALVTSMFTGVSLKVLRAATWAGCSPDQSTLLLSRDRSEPRVFSLPMPMTHARVWFHIPLAARPILRAAHTYNGITTDGTGRMFPPELVSTEQLRQARQACGIAMYREAQDLDRVWVTRFGPDRNITSYQTAEQEEFLIDQNFDPAQRTEEPGHADMPDPPR